MRKINLKKEKNFIVTAMTLAMPIAFQNLLTSCATLIDTAMVVGLGNDSVSAMGVASRFSFLLNVVCFGFASGCAALLSQFWGAKDRLNLRRSLGLVMTLSMSFGVLFAAALALFPTSLMKIFTDEAAPIALGGGYLRVYAAAVPFIVFSQIMCIALRSVECVKVPLVSSAVSVAVNVSVNYCLIDGHFGFPALGLRGAAIGSVCSYVVQSVFLFAAVLICNTPFRGRLKDFIYFKADFVRKYLKTAMPVLLNELFWALGTNIYVMVLARQGVENHSGYTLYENIQQLFFVFFVGICGACSVMVGMRVGSGEHGQAYSVAKRFAIMTPVLGVILGLLLVLLRNPILSLFAIETAGARDVASDCLLFYGFWVPIRMIPYTLICGIFRSGGDTKSGWIYDSVGIYALGIPALLITSQIIRPENFVVLVAVMFIAEDCVKGFLCVRRFFSKKWIKQITDINKLSGD